MSTINAIAKVCHEVNRAYCEATGDNSQPHWDNAPTWQRESACKGVQFRLDNPGCTAQDLHESWLRNKSEEGWVYAEHKNPERREHPDMVPYDQLSEHSKVKDHLFAAVISAMT